MKRKNMKYSKEEVNLITEMYPDNTNEKIRREIYKQFGVERTLVALVAKAKSLGLKKTEEHKCKARKEVGDIFRRLSELDKKRKEMRRFQRRELGYLY